MSCLLLLSANTQSKTVLSFVELTGLGRIREVNNNQAKKNTTAAKQGIKKRNKRFALRSAVVCCSDYPPGVQSRKTDVLLSLPGDWLVAIVVVVAGGCPSIGLIGDDKRTSGKGTKDKEMEEKGWGKEKNKGERRSDV